MKNRRIVRITAVCFLLALAVLPASSETPEAEDIMRRMEKNLRGDSSSGRVEMEINLSSDRKRTIEVDFWLSGSDKALARIVSPPREAGQATLKIRNSLWNYMPSVESTMNIPISMIMQNWKGSHFTYDDILRATSIVDDYRHRLAGEEIYGDEELWRIESVPKPGVPVVWGMQVFLVGRDFLPRKQEFLNESGRVEKTLEFSDFRKTGERIFPHKWVMADNPGEDAAEESFTVLRYKKIDLDSPVNPDIFSLRQLTR